MKVVESIAADPKLKCLKEAIARSKGVVVASGLWGSSAPMVTAIAIAPHRTVLYVTAHLEQADHARDDLELFSDRSCQLFPAWETLAGEGAASSEIEAERLKLAMQLTRPRSEDGRASVPQQFIVAPIQALMQPTPTPAALTEHTLTLSVGEFVAVDRVETGSREVASDSAEDKRTGPAALVSWLLDRGFTRLELVESPGDLAQRGDIVDVFMRGDTCPLRIQFLGDDVESIRRFDVGNQRSLDALTTVSLTAMTPQSRTLAGSVTDFAAYLPGDALVVLDAPDAIQTMGETLRSRLGETDNVFDVTDVLARLSDFPQLHLTAFGPSAVADDASFDMNVTTLARFETTATDAVAELCRSARDHHVHVFCDSEGEKLRLLEMIADAGAPPAHAQQGIAVHVGVLHRGFEWTSTGTMVIPHHEIFHRHRQRRRVRKLHAGRSLDSWVDLKPGEHVVHVIHGIGIFRGLKKMGKGNSDQHEEFLAIEFAEKAFVYVPCSQIDLVQKYIGAAGRRPQLSKIGGKRWDKTKQQVADSVSELAESLLRVQALRERAAGIAYPGDTQWQREFESAFSYEETEDQLTVAEEIRADLIRPRPMDRLVCGDVGYGKTELAMRAAFKVVEYGRQVAVLVPTTVLAEQHHETFRERMAEYPFAIACLSRFRTPSEQKKIIDQLKKGQIDIVIGTHRLVSQDVAFADLGLVIVDEEQRFGVSHKERLKHMRETVDVLTLTATPIPRTLHMSLMGIRDISSLQTPPIDRRAIMTQVVPFSRDLIRSAILRELSRDGQVYFVHNFVHSIASMADTVQTIVPEARVVFGHGQMKDTELEHVMHRFVRREADVLVSTTIIESGLDIPSANTIFINRADRFGLADMHQLRGRVGRSDHRAYCYLLLPPDRPPTPKATKRLKTIEEFSELGAGFRIAMRDLEIRGAGNLLGQEQSGHIAAVGYEMYCRLLEATVRRLKNEPDPNPPPVQVDLDVTAHIPRHYISADRSRIEIYRRIVACRIEADLDSLERDLQDAFGPIPKEVEKLVELAEIRVHARRFGVRSISLRPPDVVFLIDELSKAEPLFLDAPGSVRMADAQTIHLRLPPNYLEPGTLVPILRRMFVRATERIGAAV
jgi:transcription-repair coupling factor (superfamily II helicase)